MDILFVHGTGVRLASYDLTLSLVRHQAGKYLHSARVHQCLWGDAYGAKLNGGGASIPTYADQPVAPIEAAEANRIDEAAWRMLAEDPLFELRLLPRLVAPQQEFHPNEDAPWQTSVNLLKALRPSDEFMRALVETCLDSFWRSAYSAVAEDPEVELILKDANRDPREVSRALARALAASLVQRAMDRGHPGISGMRRTVLVNMLIPQLGEQPLGPFDWVTKPLLGLASRIGTRQARRNRRSLSDNSSVLAGDIILYQARGEDIRGAICDRIRKLDREIVLLAHSLGGIAAVDALVQNDLSDRVKALVTVGSQSPFFYEINALVSLPFGKPMPKNFPRKWLNIWDPNDFLSFLANGVFPNGVVKDFEARSDLPFPDAHTAYWDQQGVWEEMDSFL